MPYVIGYKCAMRGDYCACILLSAVESCTVRINSVGAGARVRSAEDGYKEGE